MGNNNNNHKTGLLLFYLDRDIQYKNWFLKMSTSKQHVDNH